MYPAACRYAVFMYIIAVYIYITYYICMCIFSQIRNYKCRLIGFKCSSVYVRQWNIKNTIAHTVVKAIYYIYTYVCVVYP